MDDPPALEEPLSFVDADVIRQITADDDGVESPYSQFGTLLEKVRTAFPFLVDVAVERARTDHGTVARECGVHAAHQNAVLRILGRHEVELGRPPLPAVVARADEGTPGEWYFDLVERAPTRTDDVPTDPAERRWLWETQRDAVYRTWTERSRASPADERSLTTP